MHFATAVWGFYFAVVIGWAACFKSVRSTFYVGLALGVTIMAGLFQIGIFREGGGIIEVLCGLLVSCPLASILNRRRAEKSKDQTRIH